MRNREALIRTESPADPDAQTSRADEGHPRLRAGAAISNITPPLGSSLDGVILRTGPVGHIHDDLHARCLALDDGQTRVALAVCDLRMIARPIVDRAKDLVRQATGVPVTNILISATHTHGAPAVLGAGEAELDRWYEESLARRIADGIQRAMNGLAPAQIGWQRVERPEHLFNRRWRMKPGSIPANPFGEQGDQVKMNPPRGSQDLIEPAGPVDPQLFLVSVRHEDGRPLAVLANYGLHYVGGYVAGHVSADYYAQFAGRLQQLLHADRQEPPFVAIMSNGASGDVNNINPRVAQPASVPWVRMREVAHDLADSAGRACELIERHNRASLAVATTELALSVRRPSATRLEWARRTLQGTPGAAKTPSRLSHAEIFAGEALRLAEFPPVVSVPLQAIRIGPVGIAAAPCEVFAETGLAVKARSPLLPTFVIALANGYSGYLPSPRQHDLGGYETWPARSSHLEREAEPRIRDALLGLLRQTAQCR